MFYNFCGIFVFTLMLNQIFYSLIYGPFLAMFTLDHNIKMATNAINMHPESAFNIDHYKLKGDGSGEQEQPLHSNHYLPKDLPSSDLGFPKPYSNNVNQSNSRNENTTLFDMSNSKQQKSANLF
jgi:hypothetical protein